MSEIVLSPAFLKDFIDILDVGVVVLDSKGTVVHYNRCEALFARRRREEVIGQNFFRDVAPCMDVQSLAGRFNEAMSRDSSARPLDLRVSYTFSLPLKDGAREVEIRMASFVLSGEPYGCLVVKTRGDEADEPRARRIEAAPMAKRAAPGHLEEQVMHRFAKHQPAAAPRNVLRPSRDLRRVVQDALQECAQQGGLELRPQLPREAVWVAIDETLMRNAIVRLVQNALVANGASASVAVRLSLDSGSAYLGILYGGPSLPESFRHTRGDKVRASQNSSDDDAHPDAIALTFVRLVARAHGGRVDVESDESRDGTHVRIRLPLAPASREAEKTPKREVTSAIELGDVSPMFQLAESENSTHPLSASPSLYSRPSQPHKPRN